MDIFSVSSSNWAGAQYSINGWESCLWTERFRGDGEFVIDTYNIEETREYLPEGAFVGCSQSDVLMYVESHQIDETSDGADKLTVKGYELPKWLNNRSSYETIAWPSSGELPYALEQTGWSDYAAAWLAFSNIVRNNNSANNAVGIANDLLPDVAVASYHVVDSRIGAARQLIIEPGQKYDVIRKFLDEANIGIRAIRPPYSRYGPFFVNYDAAGVDIGTTTGINTKMAFQVFGGSDHTVGNGALNEVVFDGTLGHLKGASYLSSWQEYKNVAYVIAPIGGRVVPAAVGGPTSMTGFDRRVLLVQATDVTVPYSGMAVAQTLDRIGQDALLAHNKVVVLDGEVASHVPYVFGADYDMGDLVTFRSQYLSAATMRCTEFIRAEDGEGYRAYPTFTFEG